MKIKPRKLTCPICGKDFTTDEARRKYCCFKCAWRAMLNQANYRAALMREPPEPRTCAHCGREFTPHIGNQKYCSPKCAAGAHSKLAKERYRAKKIFKSEWNKA